MSIVMSHQHVFPLCKDQGTVKVLKTMPMVPLLVLVVVPRYSVKTIVKILLLRMPVARVLGTGTQVLNLVHRYCTSLLLNLVHVPVPR